jgi:hypothetical protein
MMIKFLYNHVVIKNHNQKFNNGLKKEDNYVINFFPIINNKLMKIKLEWFQTIICKVVYFGNNKMMAFLINNDKNWNLFIQT